MKKNGFTLIELLAVILILGIIALIAIPTVNKVLKDSKMGAFNTTAVTLGNKAEEACQLENLKGEETTSLYTIVEGKLDKPLEIKGDLPREGYILVNDKCEVAYSFYDENNVVSKNFKESKAIVNNKETAPSYGLKWVSDINKKTDAYTRTLDASNIDDDSVKVQVGGTPVTNAFDTLDIYKDILPYTDSYGNEFMLIPKFYISKTKEKEGDVVTWNYAVSKHKLNDSYYLPSNFIDEGEDNNKHIELPYVLVSKYEGGSNGLTDNEEMLVSKSGLDIRTEIYSVKARNLATKYNNDNVSGYQQYDIHVHDLLTMLFAIEFKTMNCQSIMMGFVSNILDGGPIATGDTDQISSSSGTLSNNGHNSFKYRGIENLWGNVWKFTDGVVIDQINGTRDTIYTATNSKYYDFEKYDSYFKELTGYKKINTDGYYEEGGFDPKMPFLNLPISVTKDSLIWGVNDYYTQVAIKEYDTLLTGGDMTHNYTAGLNYFGVHWGFGNQYVSAGARLVKTPIRD